MPVEFLSDEQVAVYGSFVGEPVLAEVERFFYLDDGDRDLVAKRRSDSHRLGFAVQLGTVRAVGRFLEDPLDVPWVAVEFLAGVLEIADASCVKKYLDRPQTAYEHAWEIDLERDQAKQTNVFFAAAGMAGVLIDDAGAGVDRLGRAG